MGIWYGIKDKNIPLEERWEMFVDAPNFWKVHKSYQANFRIERKIEMEWFDCFCCEKYETIEMVDIVEQIEDFIDDEDYSWTTELQIELMEEILEQNLGSFVLDW